ncbi:MAG: hypothetical protein A2X18_07845 [Bacteroidetes bacterium GWF2_40_14]|nr:MAG: hypothetical protein A2X18_07845 [Bacteroidetes bacterium GWF2_40_14]
MGIRRKISLGFVVIAAILFLSSIISVFEFNRMRNSVTNLIRDNINSINTSRMLLEITDEYNFILLSRVIQDPTVKTAEIVYDERFDNYIENIKKNFSSQAEVSIADSLKLAYSHYVDVISQAPGIMLQDMESRSLWYSSELKPVYDNLRIYKKKLGLLTQQALANNTRELQEGYYRSIMPGIIAVGAGLMLVLLFNYFINLYFISPVLLMSRAIKNYKDYNKSYVVTFDNDDEIQEMNGEVKGIIEENKKLKKSRQIE